MLPHRKLLVVFMAIYCLSGFAQDANPLKIYGFTRTEMYTDTRKMSAAVQDLFPLFPMYKDLNAAGEDLNSVSSSSMLSLGSRLGFEYTLPAGIFGAKTAVSRIETDFGGAPTYMILRIRQAYSQIFWEKSDLLVGQTWHPLFVPATMPNILSLNAGSPYQPFNRSPQIRFNHQINKLKLSVAAIYQMMYTSQGPEGASTSYQKNAIIPELYVGVEYKKDGLLVGLGGEYKSIMPNRYFVDANAMKHVSHKVLNTPAIMAYSVINSGMLTIKAKVLYGQNLVEHTILGGYSITPDNKYIPYNSMSSFVHFNYGKTHQVGLMLGYSANMGPSEKTPSGSKFYGFGVANSNLSNEKMVGNMFRITPTYSYNIKNWRLGIELDYTNAAWGNRESTTGKIIQLDRADNYRVCALLMYTF